MSSQRKNSSFTWGVILIILGILFLLQNFGVADMGDVISDYWPLVLVVIGLRMLYRRNRPASHQHTEWEKTGHGTSGVYENRVFGDLDLSFDGRTIDQFSANTVFGDIKLDFAAASFEKESDLKVNGVFGDIRIRLPQELNVELQGNFVAGSISIFGEKQDGLFRNMSYRSEPFKKNAPTVRIDISTVFGDIQIYND